MTHVKWLFLSIVFLIVATTLAFTISQKNLNEHQKLDEKACLGPLETRKILLDLVESASTDPNLPQSIKDDFSIAESRLNKLIKTSHNCED